MILDSNQISVLDEVVTRLQNIFDDYKSISELNTILLKEYPHLNVLREMASDENINKVLTEAAKNDPQLEKYLNSVGGRVVKLNSFETAAYNMVKLNSQSNLKNLQIKFLHSKTESIYHNLWTVNLHLNNLPKFKNFKPKGVRDVRNHLITHTDKPMTSGAYIFSFGVSTQGPVLRPTKPIGVPAPIDKGLESNIEEFFSLIEKILNISL